MKKIILLSGLTIFLLSSCATMFTGTKDRIRFNSNPEGAKVIIDGEVVCKTPCSVRVKRSLSEKLVEFKLEDYKTNIITLDREFNVVSILDVITPLWIGVLVDVLNGSFMKYSKKAYNVELEKDKKVSSLNPTRIEINTKDNLIDIYVMQD